MAKVYVTQYDNHYTFDNVDGEPKRYDGGLNFSANGGSKFYWISVDGLSSVTYEKDVVAGVKSKEVASLKFDIDYSDAESAFKALKVLEEAANSARSALYRLEGK